MGLVCITCLHLKKQNKTHAETTVLTSYFYKKMQCAIVNVRQRVVTFAIL